MLPFFENSFISLNNIPIKIACIVALVVLSFSCGKSKSSLKPLQPELPGPGGGGIIRDYSNYPLKKAVHYKDGTNAVGDLIPFYYQGEYHVFYLQGDEWAHIVSTDLLNWSVLPFALKKGQTPDSPDGQGIWTGSVVCHEDKFYIFYTGKNTSDPKGEQKVMVAESVDLIHWNKLYDRTFYADGDIYWNKVINGPIDDKQSYHHQSFRDPLVFFNQQDNKWWMVLHSILADGSRPTMGVYTSKDLIKWTPRDPWVIYPGALSGDCPDVFFENNQWYILSANYVYMRVDDLNTHRDLTAIAYDVGDLCVPKTMYDGKRRIAMGWITDYEGHTDAGAGGWGGIMSMPRELYLDQTGRLMQRPVKEVVNMFSKRIASFPYSMTTGGYEAGLPKDFMLVAEVEPRANPDFAEIKIYASGKDDQENYYIRLDFKLRSITYGSKYRKYTRSFPFVNGEPLKIQWFVEGSVAECFINDAYCFTMRAYDKKGSGISFKSNETTFLNKLTVYTP